MKIKLLFVAVVSIAALSSCSSTSYSHSYRMIEEGLDSIVAEVTSIHPSSFLGNLSLPATVTITIQDDQNLIERKLDQEKYSKDVGLISRDYKDLRTQVTGENRERNKLSERINRMGNRKLTTYQGKIQPQLLNTQQLSYIRD